MARLSVLNTRQFAAAAALTVLALPVIGHAQEQREHRRGEQGGAPAPVAPQAQPQVQAPVAAPVRAPAPAQPQPQIQPSGAFRWQRPTGAAAPMGAPAAPQQGRMGVVVQQQVAPTPAAPTAQGWNNRGAWQSGNGGPVRVGEPQRNEPQRNPGGNWQGNSQQGGNWRNERGDGPQARDRNDHNDRNDHGWQRGQQGDARNWNRDWQRDNRYNWRGWREEHRESFHIGRYSAPYRDYAYRRLNLGFFLEPLFFGQQYVIYDPWVYHLPPAYGPYEWVRYYDDAVLVDRDTGRVVDVIYDFFW